MRHLPVDRNQPRRQSAPLADFAARTFIETFGPDRTAEDMEAYKAKTYGVEQQTRERAGPSVLTLVGGNDGALMASAQMRIDENSVEIARFYVDRAWHGRGIAQRLMNACVDWAGSKRLWLAVWEKYPRAIAFYEKCGFRDIGPNRFSSAPICRPIA